jgi:hypothetical protein
MELDLDYNEMQWKQRIFMIISKKLELIDLGKKQKEEFYYDLMY